MRHREQNITLLKLSKLANWDYPIFNGFQYDNVTDSAIAKALDNISMINLIDTNIDWEDDELLASADSIDANDKHAYRVAALVVSINNDNVRNPIELDTFNQSNCLSCIPNGHHRIRALQYLKRDIAPFALSGDAKVLRRLIALAGE